MHGADGEFANPFDHGWRRNCGDTCRPAAAPASPFVLRRGDRPSLEAPGEATALLRMEAGQAD